MSVNRSYLQPENIVNIHGFSLITEADKVGNNSSVSKGSVEEENLLIISKGSYPIILA